MMFLDTYFKYSFMKTTSYFLYNILISIISFIIGATIYYLVDQVRYIPFQGLVSLLFSFISMVIFIGLRFSKSNVVDTKAIGISMLQSLGKLVISLGFLIPFYMQYCPVDNFYLLNFIITYLLFMILDTYILVKV